MNVRLCTHPAAALQWPGLALAAAFLLAPSVSLSGVLTTRQLEDAPRADLEILLVGNSHSSGSDLPRLLAEVLEAQMPTKSVNVYAVPRWNFLHDRLDDGITQDSLESRAWSHVILQAQKYSTSGRYYYPTDAAEEWIRRVRRQDAIPILFPEWPRRGNREEGPRIYQLHQEIASREPACIAPVGPAWEHVMETESQVSLHRSDGNHANRNGALLTAYVLAGSISTLRVDALGFLEPVRIDADIQSILRAAAATALEILPACRSGFRREEQEPSVD